MDGDVGIRELKAHLSEVLDRVAHGERIRVTDRGAPKVVIIPIGVPDRLDVGVAEGWISPGPAAGGTTPPPPRRVQPRPGITSMSILDEDRGL